MMNEDIQLLLDAQEEAKRVLADATSRAMEMVSAEEDEAVALFLRQQEAAADLLRQAEEDAARAAISDEDAASLLNAHKAAADMLAAEEEHAACYRHEVAAGAAAKIDPRRASRGGRHPSASVDAGEGRSIVGPSLVEDGHANDWMGRGRDAALGGLRLVTRSSVLEFRIRSTLLDVLDASVTGGFGLVVSTCANRLAVGCIECEPESSVGRRRAPVTAVIGSVLLHGFNAIQACGLCCVRLAGENDVGARLQIEHELSIRSGLHLEVSSHHALLRPASDLGC